MTTLEQTQPRTTAAPRDRQKLQKGPAPDRWINVGGGERMVSAAAGAILVLFGISRRSVPGALIAGVGGAMLFRGTTGHCSLYSAVGLNTAGPRQEKDLAESGVHVEQAYLINRSPEELYSYWRNFENLPRIMTHLVSVHMIDDRRSHWVARAPRIAGGKIEWDAEITADHPNAMIGWRSLEGAGVQNAGQIRFSPAAGDRGTEVHVSMAYAPPAGWLGDWVAKLFGESPKRQIREDLRNFKRIMETGETPTIIGQPHGACTGVGKRYSE